MAEDIIYVPLIEAIKKHDYIIIKSGGLLGYSEDNKQRLESILEFVQNDLYYPSFIEKLSFLSYGIAKDHIFIDGNKRSAIAIGAYFMELNDYGYLVPQYMKAMENFIVWAMENRISRELFTEKIKYIILDIEESEDFKIKLLQSLETKIPQ